MTTRSRAVIMRDAAPSLLAYFLRRVDAPEDAADLVGESLATAWSSVKRMPAEPESARMWLFGVARNVLRRHYRTRGRRDAAVTRLGQAILLAQATSSNDVDDLSDKIEIRTALLTLPENLAELMRLIYWDDFSIEQAASHLGIPASTARSQHSKAKSLLRTALEATAVSAV